MHSLDDAFFATYLAPSMPFTDCHGQPGASGVAPHFGGGLDVGPQPARPTRGERSPLEELASGAYGSRYQRPYDPDPCEPNSFAPAYTPYEPELPEPPRAPPLFAPPTLSVPPVPPEPRYEDLLMSNEWLDLFLHRLSSPVEGPMDEDDPGWLGSLL